MTPTPGSAANRGRRFDTFLFKAVGPLTRTTLLRDGLAGVTLAALAIPEVMGQTRISQPPVITDLYTLLLPVLAFAALLIAAMLVLAAVLRLGFLADFLSRSALIGLLIGIGIQVALGLEQLQHARKEVHMLHPQALLARVLLTPRTTSRRCSSSAGL